MSFTMTEADIRDFNCNNRDATALILTAMEDYAASRCCLINCLISGFVLAEQAVEKLMKAYLIFNGQNFNRNHKLPELSADVQASDASGYGYGLAQFDAFMTRFLAHYQGRYPENPDKLTSASTEEVNDIDKVVVHLFEHLPVPEEVKYRIGLFPHVIISLLNEIDINTDIRTKWYVFANQTLLEPTKFVMIRNRVHDVHMHLFGHIPKIR